jgi:MFS family permease
LRRPQWMSRDLIVVSGVSFSQDAASELLYPLLPILITSVLGAPPGVVGVVEGVATAAQGATQYVAGRLSDVRGRTGFVTAGYSLAAVGKLLVALAWIWPILLVGRVADRIGKGLRGAPRDALIADSVDKADLGKAFGFHRAADTAGAVVGPLLALALLGLFSGNIKAVVWFAVIPAVVSALLTLLLRKPRKTTPLVVAPRPEGTLNRETKTVVGTLVLISLVNAPDAVLLLRLNEIGWSTAAVVGGYVLFNIVYTVLSYPAGAVADRLPRSAVYGLGLLAFAAGFIGMGSTHGWPALLWLVVYGAFPALTDGVGKAWVSAVSPDALRGRAQGLFQSLNGFGVLFASLWVGALWSAGSGDGELALVICGVLAGLLGIALIVFGARLPGNRNTHQAQPTPAL